MLSQTTTYKELYIMYLTKMYNVYFKRRQIRNTSKETNNIIGVK
jgi:hypothetical protein